MKSLIGLIALTAISFAAEEKRRLESVTWEPANHQLRWVISKGEIEGGKYKPTLRQEYQINIDEASMSFADETRRFSKQEAQSVHQLLDVLARYAIESTIWWEEGQGEPISKRERVSLPSPSVPFKGNDAVLVPEGNTIWKPAADSAPNQKH